MFRFNLHIALVFLGFTLVEVFGPVYFYQIGIPLPYITLYWALFFLFRILSRPVALWLTGKLPIKILYIGSIIGFGLRYLLYGMVDGPSPFLLVLLITESVTSAFYWLFYHVCFARLIDPERVGRSVAWRDATVAAVRMIAPLGTAVGIEFFGFSSTFLIATLITVIGVLPLLSLHFEERGESFFSWKRLFHGDRSGGWLFFFSSITSYGNDFLWRIALFLHIGNNYGFGGIVSLAIAFQIVGTFFVGHRFDVGKGIRPVQAGIVLLICAICGRALLPLTVPMAVALDFLIAVGTTFLGPYVNSMVYRRSKVSKNVLTFQFLTESGWDMGGIVSLLLASLFIGLGVPVQMCCLLGIPGFIGLWFVLSRVR